VGTIAVAGVGMGIARLVGNTGEKTGASPGEPDSARERLRGLQAYDETFSLDRFEEFVRALYAELQTARARGTLGSFSAYVQPPALEAVAGYPVVEVRGIEVREVRIAAVSVSVRAYVSYEVVIEIEAEYTEVTAGGEERGRSGADRWGLTRRA